MRTVVRFLIAGALAVAVAGLAGSALAVPVALAGPAAPKQGQPSGLAVSIDSVSPQFASASSVITVKGTITNHTGEPLDGVQVQLRTSPALEFFTARSQMGDFANGLNPLRLYPVVGSPWVAPGVLHSGATMSWTASFPAASQGYTPYEVYPIEAQALSSAFSPLGDARTFLPYWPKSGGAPDKLSTAWIWPLIDAPQQGACSTALASNELAASLAPGGRLNGLLAAGLEYAGSTDLTWAVDPALLSDATAMTRRYKVGGDALCTGTVAMPASRAAASWLDELRQTSADDEPMFVTPYADPDVSALVHAGLDNDLEQDYTLGNSQAQRVLARPFGGSDVVAWPADGEADASVLTSLARDGQAGTTVLNSSEMPAPRTASGQYPPDDAVTSVPTGIGTTMGVLLADSDISADLARASTGSSRGSQFSVEQDFLAETAMIVAEAPNSQRSVVIAPPRRWDPSEAEAAALLRLTKSAPWLRSASLGSLASQAGEAGKHAGVTRKPPPDSKLAPQELSSEYMNVVKSAGDSARLYHSMLYKPSAATTTSLQAAVAATESSAWRGRASSGGRTALRTLLAYFSHRDGLVTIITGDRTVLAGTSGVTPVSVKNGLDVAVQVKVRALAQPGSQVSVGNFNSLVMIPPLTTEIVRLPLHSGTLGSTLVQLQLLTANGMPFGKPQSLSVESTRFGRTLLIVIAAALGVLVLSSVARWVRRKWHEDISGADGISGGTG